MGLHPHAPPGDTSCVPRGIVVAVCEELRRGISPVDHVADVLERLSGDRHNAVVALDGERALRDAAALTAELRDRGPRGPLHGLAVGVKDLIDVAGLPTRAGSAVRADAPPAARDAEVVARLRRAGAVVVAKLHTHEFGVGPTGDVSVDGPARNPRAPGRIPGGSSSGPAAADPDDDPPVTRVRSCGLRAGPVAAVSPTGP